MAIKKAAGQEVALLVADLDAESEERRESAVARLAVIGTRAVERLATAVLAGPSPRARAGALRALEATGDQRGLEPAVACLADSDPDVSTAAVDVLRRLLRSEHGAEALDRLTALALDRSGSETLRLAALDALGEVPARILEPLRQQLQTDPSERLRQRASGGIEAHDDPTAELEAAASRSLPGQPAVIHDLIAEAAATVPLPTLHRLVTMIREREAAEPRPERRTAWTVARGAVHRALADRDSNVALYDLRESLSLASAALPIDFVATVGRIGDASCLEPIAIAHAAAATADDWWKRHLADAFQAILQRERLTRRHQAVKRVLARWPGLAADLPPGRKT